jgi:transposase-like protein
MNWTREQIASIVARRGKHSASKIAADYGVTRDAIIGVWNRARANDPSIPKLSCDVSGRRIRMRAAYRRGKKTLKEVAKEFGVSPATVWIAVTGYRKPSAAERALS